ncbi:MAG: DUF6526 family protein [Bacteroidetes bacterium]|nr:DUF6526 family protein [Bacteroidota bacterium]
MSNQNFDNHARMVPLFHYVGGGILFLTLIGSVVNLVQAWGTGGQYSASLLLALTFAAHIMFFYSRLFALAAQDRVIRLEESLRSQRLTGQPIDSRLTVRQIIGLRFASDEEFAELGARAVAEGMSEKETKQAVKNWREDNCRV